MAVRKHTKKKAHHHEVHHTEHHTKHHAPAHKPKTALWVAGGVILLSALYIAMNYSVAGTAMDKPTTTSSTPARQAISAAEQKKIDQWIADSGLNAYGDTKGTMYIGGTPLFNEATGKYRDLYGYILEQHPDRPWNK